jgi:hypothetical protein
MTKNGWIVLTGFVAVPLLAWGVAVNLPTKDRLAECKAHCGFRHHRLVPDPAWGKNKSGEPARYKCECF